MNNRKNVYDTSMPDKFKILYTMQVDNPDQVELCIRSKLYNYKYRDNKDYYDCSLNMIKQIFHECKEFLIGGAYCNKCDTRLTNIDKLIKHSQSDHNHNINGDDILILQMLNVINEDNSIIKGGTNINNDVVEFKTFDDYLYFYKYLKYKYKYMLKIKLISDRHKIINNLIIVQIN